MNRWNYLVVLRPTREGMLSEGPTDAEKAAVGAHFAYYSRLVEEGRMLLAGRTTGEPADTIGIAIIHASSLEEAQALVDADPVIVQSVMTAQVQPYSLALFNPKGSE